MKFWFGLQIPENHALTNRYADQQYHMFNCLKAGAEIGDDNISDKTA